MRILISLISGLIFGVGLVVSGMANPAKVQNFLDIAGNWDPSLAFVMIGAIAVSLVGFRIAKTMAKPVLAGGFREPGQSEIDHRLILGASLFGIGWGMVGLCPGPAIVALPTVLSEVWLFFVFMTVGIIVTKTWKSDNGRSGNRAPAD